MTFRAATHLLRNFILTLATAALSPLALAGGLPGMQGLQHIGITAPSLRQATDFFVEVLGCEAYFTFGEFKFADDWMERHLNVHPRAVIKDFQMVRCGNGTNLEIFEYSAPDQNRRLPRNSDIGGHHLAFYVDDMDAAIAYLALGPAAGAGEFPARHAVRAGAGSAAVGPTPSAAIARSAQLLARSAPLK